MKTTIVNLFGYVAVFCLTFSLLTKCDSSKSNSTIRQLFIIYRHGDRSPVSLYPTDPNPPSVWQDGLGQLTNIGKEQHYALGKFFRRRYSNLITGDLQEIVIRSSNKDRCLDSAECNLAGIYPPDEQHLWNKYLKWQPIPIHTMPESEDIICTTTPDCPEYNKEMDRIKKRPDVQEFLQKHQVLFEILTNNSGSTVNEWNGAAYIFNTLFIESLYKLKIPSWATPIWNEMNEVADYSFSVPFSSQLSRRLRGGPLLGEIISQMEKKVSDALVQNPNIFMYSTHDIVVSAFLSALGTFNNISPPYCSTVLVELHENGPHNHTVRIFYHNTTNFDPSNDYNSFPLTIPGCQTDCPLGHFIRLTQDVVPIDWKEECGTQAPINQFSPIAMMIICAMGVVILLFIVSMCVILWLRCQKEKSGVRYQRVSEEPAY